MYALELRVTWASSLSFAPVSTVVVGNESVATHAPSVEVHVTSDVSKINTLETRFRYPKCEFGIRGDLADPLQHLQVISA